METVIIQYPVYTTQGTYSGTACQQIKVVIVKSQATGANRFNPYHAQQVTKGRGN